MAQYTDPPGAPPAAPGGPNTKSAPAPSNPAPAPSNSSGSDWTNDPIYQLVLAQENLAIAQAKAEALREETEALIAYGDYNLALKVTGDKNVALAAQKNKASTLAQLMAKNKSDVLNTNETENQNNLFYSSDRGYQLGLAQQAYLFNQAGALQGVQGNLSTIRQNLLAAEQNAYLAEQNAAANAYGRAVQSPPGVGSSSPPPWPGGPVADPGQPGGAGYSKASNSSPYPVSIKANPTGGSANVKQGVFAIH